MNEYKSESMHSAWEDMDFSDLPAEDAALPDEGEALYGDTSAPEEAANRQPTPDESDEDEGEVTTEPSTEAEELFELKHLKEIKRVTRGEVIALAQKGLDYDRIRLGYDSLREKLSPSADARQADIRDFLHAHPEVDPGDIPQSVWLDVSMGASLTQAYDKWFAFGIAEENALLKARIAELELREKNAWRALGSQADAGGKKRDPLEEIWNSTDY